MNRSAALLIHYYFPPIHSIGCKRNMAFAQEWLNHLDTVKVLTTRNRDCLPIDDSIPVDHFDITALETRDYRTQSAKSGHDTVHYNESRKSGVLTKFAIKAINTPPLNRWIGEGGRRYIREGIKHGSQFLEKHPRAYLYSSFRPYSDHIIAATLKQRYPETRWIADFRDADVDPLYKLYLHKGWQQRFNRNILQYADKIITVSDGVTQNVSDYHHSVMTIRNGVNLRANAPHYTQYTIAYTGSLYGDHRTPKALLSAVKNLLDQGSLSADQIRLIYAGKDSIRYTQFVTDAGLSALLDDRGMVSSCESLEIQSRAQCNLLMTSATPGYTGILTGKVYEYLGAGNPVICLVSGIKDPEIDMFFDDYQLGYVHYNQSNNIDGLTKWVAKNSNLWLQSKQVAPISTDSIKNTLSWGNQFRQLIAE